MWRIASHRIISYNYIISYRYIYTCILYRPFQRPQSQKWSNFCYKRRWWIIWKSEHFWTACQEFLLIIFGLIIDIRKKQKGKVQFVASIRIGNMERLFRDNESEVNRSMNGVGSAHFSDWWPIRRKSIDHEDVRTNHNSNCAFRATLPRRWHFTLHKERWWFEFAQN